MTKREQENRDREKREREKYEREKHEHEKGEYEEGGREHRGRPHGTGYGTERAVYLEYLARKWEGSVPPTPQAYARALQQWRQLPGSVVTAPADLGVVPQAPPAEDSNQSQDTTNNTPGEERRR